MDRALYRMLMRQARRHDATPALKALLVHQRTRVYDRELSQWTELEEISEVAEEELHGHAHRLFGGGSESVWYAPQRSLVQLVRDGFRERDTAAADGDASSAAAARRDVAFAALRQLRSNRDLAARVLTHYTDGAFAGATGDSCATGERGAELTLSPLHRAGVLLAHPLQCSGSFWRTILLVTEYDKAKVRVGDRIANDLPHTRIAIQGATALVVNRSVSQRRVLPVFRRFPPFFRDFWLPGTQTGKRAERDENGAGNGRTVVSKWRLAQTGRRLGDVVSAQHLAASRLLQMFEHHPLW